MQYGSCCLIAKDSILVNIMFHENLGSLPFNADFSCQLAKTFRNVFS